MENQWSLVLFTALTGMGGCMCSPAWRSMSSPGRAKAAAFPAALVSLIVAVVGGLASVTHLSHPDRIMGALSHPTSGIFTEALLVGCLCVCVVVYLVLLKREVGAGARKVVAVIGAVFGVLLSFMAGESYLMEARPVQPPAAAARLLADGRAGASPRTPGGCGREAKDADVAPVGRALLIGGVLGAAGAAAYVLWAGPADGVQWALLAVAVIGAGVVPAVCGALAGKNPGSLMAAAGGSVACAFVGAVSYRCIMWLITVPIANLFLNVL